MKKKDILDACTRIRIASIVSDNVIDFMKEAALLSLKKSKAKKPIIVAPELKWNPNWVLGMVVSPFPITNRTIGAYKRSKCGNYYIKIRKQSKPFVAYHVGGNFLGRYATEALAETRCQEHAIELVQGTMKGCKIKFVDATQLPA